MIGYTRNTMVEGKVKGAEVEKKERNPKEVDLDPGQEKEEETGPGLGIEIETEEEMTTEKEVEEIETDHQDVIEVQGNTDPIHLLVMKIGEVPLLTIPL